MRALVLASLALCLLLPAAESQRVATDYIRIVTQPAFQYRADQDVEIPAQVRLVRGGVPQPDLVSLEVRWANGTAYPNPDAATLKAGVAPYPRITTLNLGRLEPGLYRINVHAASGGLARDWPVEFDVVHPPREYSASLVGTHDSQGRFLFKAHERGDNFTLTMYRDSDAGIIPLRTVTTDEAELEVPYIPGQTVKISVRDRNGWLNAENGFTDWQTGFTSYPPYAWNPDYKQITNYQRHSWTEFATAGGLVLASFAVVAVWLRRRA
jgi:hypothetical protein